MSLRTETCSYCNGRKVAERFEERVADTWRDGGTCQWGRGMPAYAIRELQGSCVAMHPESFRWATVPCPRCDGAGEYEVEYFTCKIF